MTSIVYSPHYNISFGGIEKLHPFDSAKYGRAWQLLRVQLGDRLTQAHVRVDRPITDHELARVHTPAYLARIKRSSELAVALEVPLLRWLPSFLIRWRVVRPMRWAVRGSVLAVEAALQHGVAVNLSGGYHHAKPDQGEGFCLYSDIALAVQAYRENPARKGSNRLAYIDLDAHQGNGVCHQFMNDPEVFILDMYNAAIYPQNDRAARDRIDCNLQLSPGCRGVEYLNKLRHSLPPFLDSLAGPPGIGFGIYNAGTDVFRSDPLGAMSLEEEDILERDLFVIEQFRQRNIPVLMLPSGGYTRQSYRLIASTVKQLVEHY